MTGLTIVLSPPEAVQQFRQIAQFALEREGELAAELRQTLEQKARELGVHPTDEARVLQQVLASSAVQVARARREAEATPAPVGGPHSGEAHLAAPIVLSLPDPSRNCFVLPDLTAHGMLRRLSRGGIGDVDFLDDERMLIGSAAGHLLVDLRRQDVLWEVDGHGEPRATDKARVLALVVGSRVYVWDMRGGRLLHRLEGHGEDGVQFVYWVEVSDDGQLLALATWRTVSLWRTADGHLLRELKTETGGYSCGAFSPDSRLLATSAGLYHPTIHLWDTTTGRRQRRLKGQMDRVDDLAFTADGTMLVAWANTSIHAVQVWDVTRGRLLWERGEPHSLSLRALTPDGQRLIVHQTLYDSTPRVLDTATGREAQCWEGYDDPVFSSDGRLMAAARQARGESCFIHICRAESGERVREIEVRTYYSPCLAFSASGRRLASWGSGLPLQLWDVATGREEYRLEEPESVRCATFSRDGSTLALVSGRSGQRYGTLRLLETKSWQDIRALTGIGSVAFSPDGRWLVCNGENGIRLHNATTFAEIKWLAQAGWHEVVFSPDGRWLAATAPVTVCVWDTRDWQVRFRTDFDYEELARLGYHPSGVNSASFSSEGECLAIAVTRGDEPVLWHTVTWTPLRWLGAYGPVSRLIFGPRNYAFTEDHWGRYAVLQVDFHDRVRELWNPEYGTLSALFHPVEPLVATSMSDGTIRFRAVQSGQEVRWLETYGNAGSLLAFSPDGRFLVSRNGGAVRLWRMP